MKEMMKLFNAFEKKKLIGGVIKYHNLEDWWFNELTDEERNVLLDIVGNGLIEGEVKRDKYDFPALFLGNYVSNVASRGLLPFAKKMIRKTYEIWDRRIDLEDMHFLLTVWIRDLYIFKEDIEIYGYLIRWCRASIIISDSVARLILNRDRAYERLISDINYESHGDSFIKRNLEMHKETLERIKEQELFSHIGFQKFAELHAERGNYDEAIKILEEAEKQGWNGNWKLMIEEIEKEKKNFKKSI